MSFNGSGTFNLATGNPVVTGTTISSTWANNTLSDIATGLSNCITRDGQSPATANIPMGSHKLTGLSAGTTAGDSARYEQVTSAVAITGGAIDGTPIGGTTAAAGAFTTLSASSTVTLSGGTANGVLYLNGSKQATSGSALTFDGTGVKVGATGYPFINPTGYYVDGGYAAWIAGTTTSGGFSDMVFNVRSSEGMRLTSTGLGIGTSSPNAKLRIQNDNSTIPSLLIRDGGTPAANMIEVSSNATGNMLILNASGNLGLGVTPSGWNTYKALQIAGAGFMGTSSDLNASANAYYNGGWKYYGTGAATLYNQSAGIHSWYNAISGTAGNAISLTQTMTLDASGNLLVGGTSASSSSGVGFKVSPSATHVYVSQVSNLAGNDTTYHLYNTNATYNGFRFYVGINGGIANYSGNNVNLSDERTKKNIENAGNYLNKICAIPVKLFNYKDEPEGEQKTLGVIAQDVELIAPELVDNDGFGETPAGEKPLKSIYTTDMMFAMMKAIQELKAELDTLKQQLGK